MSPRQADEYRIEAKRLARALAAATGGAAGYSGRISAGLTSSKPGSSVTNRAGDDDGGGGSTMDRVEEDGLPAGAATLVGGWLSRATLPFSRLPRSRTEDRLERGPVEATGLSPSENEAAWQLLATKRRSGEEIRPLKPSLAWEATEGARVREYSSDRPSEARGRDMPRATPFAPPATNGFDALGLGLTAFPPSATVGGDSARGARRTSPSRLRHGRPSARIGYGGSPRGRGSASPDRSYSYGGEEVRNHRSI